MEHRWLQANAERSLMAQQACVKHLALGAPATPLACDSRTACPAPAWPSGPCGTCGPRCSPDPPRRASPTPCASASAAGGAQIHGGHSLKARISQKRKVVACLQTRFQVLQQGEEVDGLGGRWRRGGGGPSCAALPSAHPDCCLCTVLH